MPGADRAAVKDVLGKRLKHRAHTLQHGRVAPHQQVELALLGMFGRARQGRVQKQRAFGRNGGRQLARGVGLRGRAVHHHCSPA